MKGMTQNYYDKIAQGYNLLYGDEQRKKIAIVKEAIVITPQTKILDIGCGTGISTDFECKCIGIDPSKKLIEKAKKVNRCTSNPNNHKYIVAAAEDLGKKSSLRFREKEFDYVLCISAIHHIDLGCLKEIKKICKTFVVSILKKSSRKQQIINTIKRSFIVKKEIDEGKDIILLCEC